MRLLWFALIWAAIALPHRLSAGAADTCYYVDPAGVDLAALLGPPPAGQDEIDTLLKLQENRSYDDLSRIAEEVTLNTGVFRDVLGGWFNPQNVPQTELLLDRAEHDLRTVAAAGKDLWHRPRPPMVDTRIQPAIGLPKAPYPSIHAAVGACWSLILAELLPGKSQELLHRGGQIGSDRSLAGVEFPSDVAAGEKLGNYLACRFLEHPGFRADFQRAQKELEAWLPAGPTGAR